MHTVTRRQPGVLIRSYSLTPVMPIIVYVNNSAVTPEGGTCLTKFIPTS